MGSRIRRAVPACLVLVAFIAVSSPATAADYPRRVAVAPFATLTSEDIRQTVAVLPRLLMSRLMALSGAEVVLLSPGDRPPAEQARAAGMPLLIQGTVAKLGKGYSIDVTATEVESGKPAGAFFASAATEDEIISQLGILSGEMVEKLFGIKTAARIAPPPPPSPAAPPQVGPAYLPPAPAPGAAAVASPPPVPSGPWEPRSMVKVSFSDKIPDEIYRIGSGDVDGDGANEIAFIGARRLWVYKVSGDKVLPFRKMERTVSHLFLNVEVVDLDGDGRSEIVVTDLVGDSLKSFVLKLKGDTLEQVAPDIPYYIISLEDGKGSRRLAGQVRGLNEPFYGKVVYLKWDGKTLVPDGNVPVSVDQGIFGLAAFPGDAEGRFLYLDADEHLRLVDKDGKTRHKTKEYYSGAVHLFTWGTDTRSNVGPDRHYIRGRIVPVSTEGGSTVFLVRQVKANSLLKDYRSYDWSRLVYLSYAGDGFTEKGASERIDNLMTDFAVLGSKAGRGTMVAVPVLDTVATYGTEPVSRIQLYRMD